MSGSINTPKQAKDIITKIWNASINEVKGEAAVKKILQTNHLPRPDQIIAIGKAATSMFKGAFTHYYEVEKQPLNINGLIITKYGHTEPLPCYHKHQHIKQWQSAHPLPDQNSLLAGKDALDCVAALPQTSNLLLLISGGASSLAEVLMDSYTLDDLISLNTELLESGADIKTINTIRKQISLIKDGKLLSHFNGKHVTTIAISDVPNEDLEFLGSGIGSGSKLNPQTTKFFSFIAAANETARNKAAKIAKELSLTIVENSECLYDDIVPLSEKLSQRIKTGPKGLYIWGGEPTVKLPKNPGSGGRNQALGLLIAKQIQHEENIALIVAGTDGTDGPTNAAGAIIDGATVCDIKSAQKSIDKANAGPYLKSRDALFITGPTGTNVMDLTIGIKF